VSRFWLTYQTAGRLFGVVILDSTSLIDALNHAADYQIDHGALFANGSKLDADLAALVPPSAIGRMLQGIPKRPAASSVKRRRWSRRKQA
jgi:hypothetical protein